MKVQHEERLRQTVELHAIDRESAVAGACAELQSKLAETELTSRLKVRDTEISMSEQHEAVLQVSSHIDPSRSDPLLDATMKNARF
eukprot:SAG11_NODE_285_length_11230_cov_6.339412_3_plen_86_part_00